MIRWTPGLPQPTSSASLYGFIIFPGAKNTMTGWPNYLNWWGWRPTWANVILTNSVAANGNG